MKYALAILVLLAFSAPMRADSLDSPYGPLYFPDGATVTATGAATYPGQFYYLDYSFADGTGATFAPATDGNVGDIAFSTPITAITFSYVWAGDAGFPFEVNFWTTGGSGEETFSDSNASGTETLTFDSDVTGLQWIGGLAEEGWGGITSLSYTEAPEPGSLLLAGIGLVALLGLKRVQSSARHKDCPTSR
jgi:PEP-CTERM motif